MKAQQGLAVKNTAAPLQQRACALPRCCRHVCRVARLPDKDVPTKTFKSDSTVSMTAPVRGPAVPWPRQVAAPQQEGYAEAPAPPREGLWGRYLDWWDALPSHHKVVLAGSLSFVICNMVRNAVSADSSGYICMHAVRETR